eukprot:1194804-Prorocentrum_minimum.AAC.2
MPPPLAGLVHVDRICPLPSPDWSTSTEYAPSPRRIGPHRQNMRFGLATRRGACRRRGECGADADAGRHAGALRGDFRGDDLGGGT